MNKTIIAENLKALRADISIESLAKELDVSPSAIRMYEQGKRVPRDETKLKYARKFERTVGEIFFQDSYTISVGKRPKSTA